MESREVKCFDQVSPVSTHVTFCQMLQSLAADQTLLFKDAFEPEEQGQRETQKMTVPSPVTSLRAFRGVPSEQKARQQQKQQPLFTSAKTPQQHVSSSPQNDKLKAAYLQAAKEAVTAFTGRHLYQRMLCDYEKHADLPHLAHSAAAAAAANRASTADRQTTLRQGIHAFLEAVTQVESELRKPTTVPKAPFSHASSDATPAATSCAMLQHVPLHKWAGHCRYNDRFVKCTVLAQAEGGDRQSTARGAKSNKRAAFSLHAVVPVAIGLAVAPTPLVQMRDVEAELRRYWKLHDEAAARSRLAALRNHDAEVFAEHVSLLKVSALLDIMEKTEGFMRRIGMRLELQAAGTSCTSHSSGDGATGPPSKSIFAVAGRGSDSEYARFRAYVASMKNEFQLMHHIDAFVPSQPQALRATLLPHQMDGLRFLVSLHANHINGILADEMGVGKTVQTLAFLLHLKEQRMTVARGRPEDDAGVRRSPIRPHLVLAPLSVVREWREACEQFVAESFRVCLFQELEDPVRDAPAYDLVLMPVHAVRYTRAASAARVQWDYVVVDEAHKAVANLQTFTAQAILALPCARRLVLTGTPLSSDLQELWSLLHFLNPSVFSDNDAFEQVFRRPFQVYEAKEMELTEEERGLLVLRLHQVLRPFLLRRTKADVDTSLRMTFHCVRCPLSAVQQRVLRLLRLQKQGPAVLSVSSSSDEEEEDEESGAAAAAKTSLPRERSDAACPNGPLVGASHVAQKLSAVDSLTKLAALYLPGLAVSFLSTSVVRDEVVADKCLGLSSANVSESTAQQVCNHAFLQPFFSQVLERRGLDETTLESAGDAVSDSSSSSTTTTTCYCNAHGAAAMTLACSGKFLFLHLLLSRLFIAGYKVVLFTHWLSCVDLLLDYLKSRGWHRNTEVLTGSSSEAERKASVRRFRNDPACLFFVLSMKAGGCGINLQAAHIVVLLDRDYTATNEDQALARVYRIGQRHTVRALYFSTDDPSEHRVTQRAELKNRPRRAIIDDGVYQVTGLSGKVKTTTGEDEDEEEGDTADDVVGDFLEREEACDTKGDTVDTAPLWAIVSASAQNPGGFGVTTSKTQAAECQDSQSVVEERTSAERGFWAALRRLVSSLDELILTDDDRSADTKRSAEENAVVNEHAAEAGSTWEEKQSVLLCLRKTLPPESYEWLEEKLRCRAHEQSSSASLHSPSHAHGVTTAQAAEMTRDAALCEGDSAATATELENESNTAEDTPARDIDPLRTPELFWLEFAALLRLACDGPAVLWAAVDTAEANNRQKEDPAEQLRCRRRREKRAAKCIRLATVEVPNSYREKCWEDGVEDETEIAARYLDHLDARANAPKKRRKAKMG